MSDIEITKFLKDGGPLTKQIHLAPDGAIANDSSRCRMSAGLACRVSLAGVHDLGELIGNMPPNAALALGVLGPGLPNQVPIAAKDSLDRTPGAVTRSKANIVYSTRPGFVLLDHDTKSLPQAVADRLAGLSGFSKAIASVLPGFETAGSVLRRSTCCGICNVATGLRYPGSNGAHLYVSVMDISDAKHFLYVLHDEHVRAALGFPKNAWRGNYGRRPPESHPETLQARAAAGKHRALAIWTESSDPRGSLAEKYLAGRSLELPDELAGEAIRFHSACPFGAERFPALVCLIRLYRPKASRPSMYHTGKKGPRSTLGKRCAFPPRPPSRHGASRGGSFRLNPSIGGKIMERKFSQEPGVTPIEPAAERNPTDVFADLDALREKSKLTVKRKVVLVNVSVGRPANNVYFRINPDQNTCLDATILIDEKKTVYFVTPEMRSHPKIAPRIRNVTLRLTVTWPSNEIYLWPVPLFNEEHGFPVWRSARKAAELAESAWVQMAWDDARRDHTVEVAEGTLAEPQWPDKSMAELLMLGFSGRVIDNENHPYVRRLRGLSD